MLEEIEGDEELIAQVLEASGLDVTGPEDPEPSGEEDMTQSEEEEQPQLSGYMENVRIFRYDPDSKIMHQPEDSVRVGVASAGGFRGSLDADGEGNGLRYTVVISSGTGETSVSLVTLPEDTLHVDEQWHGRLDRIPGEILREEIEWYERGDTSGLDSWTSAGTGATISAGTVALTEATAPAEAALAETTAPPGGRAGGNIGL